MPLSIRIISSPDGEPITQWNQSFPEEGGEIGRAFGAIMQLNDRAREVSGTHAIIRQTSRGYQIEDSSKNGLFMNGSTKALGRGNVAILNDGDVLDVGCYRLLVSCFFPDKATVNAAFDPSVFDRNLCSEDPFKINKKEVLPPPQAAQKIERVADFSSDDLVLDDPFLSDEIVEKTAEGEFVLDFNSDDGDEPFSEEEYKAIFPSLVADADNLNETSFHSRRVSRFQGPDIRIDDQIDKALEMALTRFLSDISPDAIEEMFDELSHSKSWLRKPRYWIRYKRYFARQTESSDWKIKFLAYFHDALRLKRSMNGGDR